LVLLLAILPILVVPMFILVFSIICPWTGFWMKLTVYMSTLT